MRIISFYLPQFHEIPENNEWWGKGFTEWSNVKKAKPLFKNHYQPRTPYENNYYNLLEENTFKSQVELAKEYGVDGFCFYHYWFKDGKKLLEKPVEAFLEHKEYNLNFCLCWANEPWSRRWDGSENQVLMPQSYGDISDWRKHYEYLHSFFLDKRYIRENNKPLLIIYRPDLIPDLNDMIDCWQEIAKEHGLNGLTIAYQHPTFHFKTNADISRFDYGIEFEPQFSLFQLRNGKFNLFKSMKFYLNSGMSFINISKLAINKILEKHVSIVNYRFPVPTIYSYDEIVKISTSHKPNNNKMIPGAFTAWDNTPRRGKFATIYNNSNPLKFEDYVYKQLIRANNIYHKDILFINAWNEWAEGAYLEPDEKYQFGYLEAIKKAKQRFNDQKLK